MPKSKSKAKTSQEKMQGEVVLGHIELNGQGSQPSHKSGKSGRAEEVISGSSKNAQPPGRCLKCDERTLSKLSQFGKIGVAPRSSFEMQVQSLGSIDPAV
jgi:hypothetical protein